MGKKTNDEIKSALESAASDEKLVKIISEDVENAIKSASDALDGEVMTADEALKAAGKEDLFFNPTLSQYREGMVLNTDRSLCKIKKTPVGRGGNSAWVITCPVGYRKADGTIEYTGAFNMYPSTLRKQIQVTDADGDAVLDENGAPKVCPTEDQANSVWKAARACQGPENLLEFALDKKFLVGKIYRDFGPSVFVEQRDGSRKATSHKLTSAPSFTII